MQSRKNPDNKLEPTLAEVAEKTGLRIRGLQNRLAERPLLAERPVEVQEQTPSNENLELELQKYFETRIETAPVSGRLREIRNRVVEGVARKILRSWECSQEGRVSPLENEVVELLIERVCEGLAAPERPPRSAHFSASRAAVTMTGS